MMFSQARLPALSKVLWKASLNLVKEQVSLLAKSAASNIFSYFVLFGHTGERLIRGLRRKKLDIASFATSSQGRFFLASKAREKRPGNEVASFFVGSGKSLASRGRF